MRTDMRYKLTLASVFAAVPLFIVTLIIFMIGTGSVWAGLFPIYLLAGGFILTFILGFVPFMKDHMWLSVILVTLLSAVAGLIFHLI